MTDRMPDVAEQVQSQGIAACMRLNTKLREENEVMLAALKSVREFFTDLEDGTDDDDPLKRVRQRFHAPILEVIDAAVSKAEAR